MKTNRFDQWIVAARPERYSTNKLFTDMVMRKISKPEILSSSIRSMNVTKKETFMMKLKHLPKIAVLAMAVGVLALLTGTAYAVVKTIESLNNVKVNGTSTNDFGRQQLKITLTHCSDLKEGSVTYELKRGSGLSAEDGAKTLQARCDLAVIDDWLRSHSTDVVSIFILMDAADAITAIGDNSVVLKAGGNKDLADGAKIISDGKEISKSDLKVGDTVFAYPGALQGSFRNTAAQPLRLFRVTQPPKFYSTSLQSYVNERGPCQNNSSRECLQASNINHTVLVISHGGAFYAGGVALNIKEVQGKVVSYTTNGIKIDVGGGAIYTIQTLSNIIDRYNTDDVYKLADLDPIYSKTNPEDLKIKAGDSLDISYVESNNKSSSTVGWSQILTVQLMVERVPHNLDVLRKY